MRLRVTADFYDLNDAIGSPKPGVYVVRGSAATVTKTVIRNRIMRIHCIIHRTNGQQDELRDYLVSSIDIIRCKCPDCGIAILGDFNNLNINFELLRFPTIGFFVSKNLSDQLKNINNAD